LLYFILRKYVFEKKVLGVDDIIKAFASGFTVSMCLKIVSIGYLALCTEMEDIGNACLMIGGFALAVFAIDGFYKSTKKADPKKEKEENI
jgi:hypothetical protein